MPQALAFLEEFLSLEHLEFSEDKPSLLQMLPQGEFSHPWYGKLDFSASRLKQMVQNFDSGVMPVDVALDENHDAGRATGWLKSVHYGTHTIGGKKFTGLFGEVEWTPHGKQLLQDKIYKYFSSEIGTYQDPTTETEYHNVIKGGGLTNRPFFKMMSGVKFSDGDAVTEKDMDAIFSDSRWEFNDTPSGDTVPEFRLNKPEKPKEIRKMDGLEELLQQHFSEYANLDAIKLALKEGKAATATLLRLRNKAEGAGIELGDDVVVSVVNAFTAAKTAAEAGKSEVTKLNETVVAFGQKLEDMEATAAVTALLSDGKITPAEKDKYVKLFKRDREMFAEMTADLTVKVEFGERGGTGKVDKPGEDKEFSDPTKAAEEADRYAQIYKQAMVK